MVHEKLTSMCYTGSERTTRRVVTELKKSYRRENHPVYMVSELAGRSGHRTGRSWQWVNVAQRLICNGRLPFGLELGPVQACPFVHHP